MAKKLVPLEEAAVQIGVTPDELNAMRERQQIYGYRDGASWKFKPEDLDRLIAERADAPNALTESGELDALPVDTDSSSEDVVLLSEVDSGSSGPGASSTVIGRPKPGMEDESDIRIAGSGIGGGMASGSNLRLAGKAASPDSGSDVILADSGVVFGEPIGGPSDTAKGPSGGSSKVKLGGKEPKKDSGSDLTLDSSLSVDADELVALAGDKETGDSSIHAADPDSEDVLGGSSGAGSDITLAPGDSGISLAPTDSGISLEQPPDFQGMADSATVASESSDDSGFDSSYDMGSDSGSSPGAGSKVGSSPSGSSEFDSDAVMELRTDDEFLLTPLEEVSDEDSQDSGSQVIALDTEGDLDDASSPTVLGTGSGVGGLLIADEPMLDPLGGQSFGVVAMSGAPTLGIARETQYSIWVILSLAGCLLVLALTGMMLFDVVGSMWAWDSPNQVNSSIMNMVVGMFE